MTRFFKRPSRPALLRFLVADFGYLLLPIHHLDVIDLGVLSLAFDRDGFGLRAGVLRQLLFVHWPGFASAPSVSLEVHLGCLLRLRRTHTDEKGYEYGMYRNAGP